MKTILNKIASREYLPFLILFGVLVLLIELAPINYVLHFSLDDSFYYLKTASNQAQGFGSTFDRVNFTNGYHPLWFWIVSGMFFLLKLFGVILPESQYRFVFTVTALINMGSLLLLHKIWKAVFGVKPSATLYLLLGSVVFFFVVGLETQIALLLFCLYLHSFYSNSRGSTRGLYLRACFVSFLFVSRLDFVLFFFPVIAYTEFQGAKQGLKYSGFAPILFTVIAFTLLVSTVVYNYCSFGEYFTISSKIEFHLNQFLFLKNMPSPSGKPITFGLLIFAISGGAAHSVEYVIFPKRLISQFEKTVILFYIASLGFITVHSCFNLGGIKEWYYPYPLFFCILLLYMISSRYKTFNRTLKIISIIGMILFVTIFRLNYYNFDDAYIYAKRVESIVKPNETVYQYDLSGIISFFSNRNVVNGDGLINSNEYYEYLHTGNLNGYFARHPIDYYSTGSFLDRVKDAVFRDTLPVPGGYRFELPSKNISVILPFESGGIFRKKAGLFYLVKAR